MKKLEKLVLNMLLSIPFFFVKLMKIKDNQIAFVSLESQHLESDLLLIYNQLCMDPHLKIKKVLIGYDKNNLIQDFLYMLNCFKQIIVINTSRVVLIRDNNYVISRFKREDVQVIQVWHACGAIKKFGNAIAREYPIRNYDYIISNSDFWKKPYSEAFAVDESQVITTGMPRVDHLCQKDFIEQTKQKLCLKYPQLKNKKVILYAPTFRGNIYKGFYAVPFDVTKIIEALGDEYVIIYKFHPLLKNTLLAQHERVINMNHEDTHELFTISDILISDFSSIIFDYALLEKPMYFFVPDLQEYLDDVGCFVDYQKLPGTICHNEDELIHAISKPQSFDLNGFKNTFFKYQDGKNINRITNLIYQIIKKPN